MHSQRLTTHATMALLDALMHGLRRRGVGNHPQIVREHAPADPAFHTIGAMRAPPLQFLAAFQATDPALDARAPVVTMPEPALLRMRHPFGRLGTRLGPYHRRGAGRGGIALVRGGVDPAIPGQPPGWALAHAQMGVQTRPQVRVFGWIALQHGIAADDAALDLIPPEHTAKFGAPDRLAWRMMAG
jgi:hypothetical protein